MVCFIEVKTRASLSCGDPLEAVSPHKQRKIIRTALWYLQQEGLEDVDLRFDVVAITILGQDDPEIELIRYAFDVA